MYVCEILLPNFHKYSKNECISIAQHKSKILKRCFKGLQKPLSNHKKINEPSDKETYVAEGFLIFLKSPKDNFYLKREEWIYSTTADYHM